MSDRVKVAVIGIGREAMEGRGGRLLRKIGEGGGRNGCGQRERKVREEKGELREGRRE